MDLGGSHLSHRPADDITRHLYADLDSEDLEEPMSNDECLEVLEKYKDHWRQVPFVEYMLMRAPGDTAISETHANIQVMTVLDVLLLCRKHGVDLPPFYRTEGLRSALSDPGPELKHVLSMADELAPDKLMLQTYSRNNGETSRVDKVGLDVSTPELLKEALGHIAGASRTVPDDGGDAAPPYYWDSPY